MTNSSEIMTPLNLILAVGIILLLLDMCKKTKAEKFTNFFNSNEDENVDEEDEEEDEPEIVKIPEEGQESAKVVSGEKKPKAYIDETSKTYGRIKDEAKLNMPDCPGRDSWGVSSSLLPKDDPNLENSFTEFAPNLKNENYLDSTNFQIGMQSQTLRNANLQLRSDPPIKTRENQVPWMNSTMDPETRRDITLGSQPVEVQ